MARRRLATAAALLGLSLLGWLLPRTALRDPTPTTWIVDRRGAFIGERPADPDGGIGYWPVDPVPPRVAAATLALEDRRFDRHPGVDPLAIGRALVGNLRAGSRTSGASTLAMQLARLQRPGPRSYLRKAGEALVAVGLTLRHGRTAVLGAYLRQAPYGNNIHGVAFAARRYFNKPVEDLSWAEVALLTALPQAPSLTNLYTMEGRERATQRARRILGVLEAQGWLSAIEAEAARVDLSRLTIVAKPRRHPDLLHTLVDTPASATLLRLSLDRDDQHAIALIARKAVESWALRGAGNASVMVVDRQTGQVRVAVGSVDYWSLDAGAIDYSRVRRNPGSTLKPFAYAAALDLDLLQPNTVLADLRLGPAGIANADGRFLGPLLPRQALANSRNVPAVALVEQIGLPRMLGLLGRLGLNPQHKGLDAVGAGLALGGLPVSLRELVGAWMTLGGDGRLRPFVDRADQEAVAGERVFSERAVAQVSRWLADPLARLPTFPRMGPAEYAAPIAIKTGTSGDYRDAWALGITPTALVGVWVGNAAWRPMASLSGYTAAAEILSRVVRHLHPDLGRGFADRALAPPPGTQPVALCPLSGQRPGPRCDRQVVEDLLPAEVPAQACSVHRAAQVDAQTGGPPSPRSRAVVTRTVIALPAEYAAWQQAQGWPAPPQVGPVGETITLRLLAPADGTVLMPDPEAPAGGGTLELAASADPPVPSLVWLIDGEPFAEVPHPYTLRWPLQPGRHRIAAQLPGAPVSTAAVTVTVHR
jgi:penicillin-binding protein 1C